MYSAKQSMQKLLAVATSVGDGQVNLKKLRQVVKKIQWTSVAEKKQALSLVAEAHVACFNLDGRVLKHAVKYFYQLKNWLRLAEILQIARDHGQWRTVLQIKLIGEQAHRPELQVLDFTAWFKTVGIKWLDTYIDTERRLIFIPAVDQKLLTKLINQYYVWDDFWQEVLAAQTSDQQLSAEYKALLHLLAQHQIACVFWPGEPRAEVEEQFRAWCATQNIRVLAKLQQGQWGVRCCSYIFLVLDNDGIIKIFKEVLDYNQHSRLGKIFNNEHEIFEHLAGTDLMPHCYGRVDVAEGLAFIKRSICYQSPIINYLQPGKLLTTDQVCQVVGKLADKIQQLQQRGVLYLDFKPEHLFLNLTEDDLKIDLIDFGIARVVATSQTQTKVYLADPRLGAPEIGRYAQATGATEVFYLGILGQWLLTGKHPFMVTESLPEGDHLRESTILKYFWPTIVLNYEANLTQELGDKRLAIFSTMLQTDPTQRPTLDSVIAALKTRSRVAKIPVRRNKLVPRQQKRNMILFPARMGIPHKGHIEYISRLLDLGYYVVISLQRSYTLTDRDPVPKWLVMKMVAQSLFKNGYTTDDFEFIFTPFYRTAAEMKLHFTMWPQITEVVAVASSNPEVSKFFDRYLIFDQPAMFGQPGKEYFNRSWGEILRQAVKANDYSTFAAYAASGVEKILTFAELRQVYGQPQVEFVPGAVWVSLLDQAGQLVVHGRILRYLSPEESLVRHLIRQGKKCQILNAYDKYTALTRDGICQNIKYLELEFNGEEEYIFFQYT